MRLLSRINSLEKEARTHRGSCAACNGAGRAVFMNYQGRNEQRGAPCPSCGRSIVVRYVDMITPRHGAVAGSAIVAGAMR